MPLYLAFLWHMHQPYYILGGRASLPWVRLHAVKNYLHMAELLRDYPRIHATFNLVPCLLEQIIACLEGSISDQHLDLSRKGQWSPQEGRYLLANFFNLDEERIRVYPRYYELWRLRKEGQPFSEGDLRDLVAWFNLAWIDSRWLEKDEVLRSLVEKGRGFTATDIEAILAKQMEMMERIIPLYRELEEGGQVELTTSPYYHPILPLLVDSRSAREASPEHQVPSFSHPEDAAEQIRRALEFHRLTFGQEPTGLWPPEGAIGQEVLPLLAGKVRWVASDEEILAKSQGTAIERDEEGRVIEPELLHQPYLLENAPSLAIVFRDRYLSDRIGFVYENWPPKSAAEDLVARLHQIKESLPGDGRPHLVSIILDGENPWSNYEDNGAPFLRHLYSLLSQEEEIRTVTVSEYLCLHPSQEKIGHLFTGSWIDHDLETWIGEPAQNRAWEYLTRTREALLSWQRDYAPADIVTMGRAWQEIYAAEGSDWFWWYCGRNESPEEAILDKTFRGHLANVFTLMGVPIPDWLKEPIQ